MKYLLVLALASLVIYLDAKCYILMPKEFYEKSQNLDGKDLIAEDKDTVIRLPKNHTKVRIVIDEDEDDVKMQVTTGPPSVETTTSGVVASISTAATITTPAPLSDISTETNPIVEISSGKVQGKTVVSESQSLYSFTGIPYAEPPLGELRFLKTKPVKKWDGVLQATHKPFPCLQTELFVNNKVTVDTTNSTEDCLHLNVWTPAKDCVMARTGCKALPVMVYIHGGTFTWGSSGWEWYDATQLAGVGDVVVVTMNYRLGPLGFLFSATKEAPGNAGLHDQLLAMQWVRDNIHKFGGNPDEVTLFGQSAGAISIGYHMMSPLSKGLFKRVILQSGSPFFKMADPTAEGPKKIERLANALDCQKDEHHIETHANEMIDCLRKVDGKLLMETTQSVLGLNALSFFPTYGDEFLPEDPQKMMQEGRLAKMDMLIGNNKDEGSYFIFYLFRNSIDLDNPQDVTKYEIDLYVTFGLQALFHQNPRVPRETYLGSLKESEGMQALKKACDLVGDLIMTCPTKYFAETMAQNNTVHYYEFNHKISTSTWPEWVGATHGEETPFVFGLPLSGNATEYEKKLSRNMIKAWTHFARTGKASRDIDGTNWPAFNKKGQVYLQFGQTGNSIGRGLNEKMCNFWRPYLVSTKKY